MFKPSVLALTGGLVLVASLTACTKSNALSPDQQKNAAVEKSLGADPALAGATVTASTENGVVTLTGNVNSEAARTAAAKDAQVPGVTEVDNQIATLEPAGGSMAMTAQPAAAMTARSSTARAAQPAAPAPLRAATPVQVETGTVLRARLAQALSSASASAGQPFSATLAAPVLVNGQIAIPQGAKITGTVAAADSAGHFKGQSRLVLTLAQLSYNGQTYSLHTQDDTRLAASRGKRSAETIGGGAALGTLIGALAGHGKGAAIGAAVGAGAGTAAQAMTKPEEVDLPVESVLPFTLSAPLQVVPAAATN